ncbi:MAG TPA: BamA/TamA family outer membrane protein, partial [Gemmatimonadota bacterium]|nr:BamA/TamA family outer membrane protein [Gemmatimonadota bacterium]
YSSIDREAAVTYRQPFFMISDLSLAASAFLRFEVETNYTVQRIGASGRLGYRVNRNIQSRFSVTAEHDDFSDFDEGTLIPELGRNFINPSRLIFADAVVTYDDTDSLFRPSRGYRANAAYQLGLPILTGDYGYHRLTVQVVRYFEVREGWVLATKVLPGAIFTYGGDAARVPLFQRLFAGGASSVRGFERRQLGPKDDPATFGQSRDPEPIGGNGLFQSSIELRFPIRGNWRGAAFVDAGNVWDDAGDISPGDLEYTPGAGVRYTTPVGPVRLDLAWRMSGDERDDHLPAWVFHISIGEAF